MQHRLTRPLFPDSFSWVTNDKGTALRTRYDVIVIGAGPAGATVAHDLARRGIKVMVLEKSTFPRYKCCAGGLSVRAAKLIDGHIDGVVENAISSATITSAGKAPFYGTYDKTILYTVMRDRFDHVLLQKALKAGALLQEGVKAHGITLKESGIEVSTNNGNFQSYFVIGADGANSIAAQAAGIHNTHKSIVAMESEVAVSDKDLLKWQSKVAIDIGCISAGYAWLFPKSDHVSVGIACLRLKAGELKQRYQKFLNSLRFNYYHVISSSGAILPICTGKTIVTRGRIALLGDAAGLADPLTGEGIYNAILSAKLAAPVIEKALAEGISELSEYSTAVSHNILPEMRFANMFAQIFIRLPDKVFKLMKHDERVWRGCCYLLRGDISYATIKERISSLSGVYNLPFKS